MSLETISKVTSSNTTLKIADLVSTRPRTLNELAALTGISIQGVLKHTKKLEKLGLVRAKAIKRTELSVRRVYAPGQARVGDFSIGDLAVVRLSTGASNEGKLDRSIDGLEALAQDALVQRARIGEQVRKLGRMIDELVEGEGRLNRTLESMKIGDAERLVLHTYFTEVTPDDAARTLSRYYGLSDGRKAIERAMSEARSLAKK